MRDREMPLEPFRDPARGYRERWLTTSAIGTPTKRI
jgi:hypothetical protein